MQRALLVRTGLLLEDVPFERFVRRRVQRRVPGHELTAMLTAFLVGCSSSAVASQDITCSEVSASFAQHVERTLSDTTGRFFNDFPTPTPLTCELQGMLHEELKDDSLHYHFEHLHQRYNDPRATSAFAFIARHDHFHLAIALIAHWNPDTRIEALRAVQDYRRIRPLVCTNTEGFAQLQRQDRAAVRYLIRVLESTPLFIPGSENATIHSVYMSEIIRTLDVFTGQAHDTTGDMRMRFDMPEARLQQALSDWRNWLQ